MSDFAALVQEIINLNGCPDTKRRVLDLLYSRRGQQIYVAHSDVDRLYRSQVVRKLLGTYARSDAVRVISGRFGVSIRTAQRWTKKWQ